MSDKTVADRLEVKNGRRLAVLGVPAGLDDTIGALDRRVAISLAEVVLLFAADRNRPEINLHAVLKSARPDSILWVAYPKMTSKLSADLNRDVIRGLVPPHGLDTVSQIAIDADWSAVRLKRVG